MLRVSTRGRICARLAVYVCTKPHPLLVLLSLCGCGSADCALCGAACACVAQPVPSRSVVSCTKLSILTHEIQRCTYRERATKHARMQSTLRAALAKKVGVVLVMRMRTSGGNPLKKFLAMPLTCTVAMAMVVVGGICVQSITAIRTTVNNL